jgi:hypothetical protein
VRDALGSLQFVAKDTITTDINTKRATFKLAAGSKLDLQKVRDALKEKGYSNVNVVSVPMPSTAQGHG